MRRMPLHPRLEPAARRARGLALGLLALAGGACSAHETPATPPPPLSVPASAYHLRDRVVAVVDEEAVLLSDIEQVIGLGLVTAEPGESAAALRARVLDQLIDQRLRFQVVDRFAFERVSVDLIEAQVARIAEQFPSREAFLRRLAELDLDEEELHQLVARQLMVLNYVEERLGARVFVSLDDIRTYYEEELAPRLRKAGQPVPALEDVREDIRALLKEKRLNQEIEDWTERLRREADIQVFLDEPVQPLPPRVDRVAGSAPPA